MQEVMRVMQEFMRDMNNVSYASYVSYARSYASYARSYVSYARSYASGKTDRNKDHEECPGFFHTTFFCFCFFAAGLQP